MSDVASRVLDTASRVFVTEPFWVSAPCGLLGGVAGALGGATPFQCTGLFLLGSILGLLAWGSVRYVGHLSASQRRRMSVRIAVATGLYVSFALLATSVLESALPWIVPPVLAGLGFVGASTYATVQSLRRGLVHIVEPPSSLQNLF